MKKIIPVLLIIASLLGLCGCITNKENPYPYKGEYKELYTTAIYSIPNAVGYMYHGEGGFDSDIYIWEQDDYGRVLFSYCEDYGNKVFSLVISQRYDDANVYFYPDTNYVLTIIDSEKNFYGGINEDYLKNKTEDFYLESRDKLKEENDWNKPLDKTKCISYPITDHKSIGKNIYSLSEDECNEILNEYTKTLNMVNPEEKPHRYNSILQVDAKGKILHEIYGIHRNYDKLEYNKWDPDGSEYTSYKIILWVITDKDGSYDKENGVMVMYSKANEKEKTFVYNPSAILEFKNKNGWETH